MRPSTASFGLDRAFRVILDLITIYFMLGYFGRPMHLFGSVGLVSGGLGALIGLYLSVLKFAFGYSIGERPLLFAGGFAGHHWRTIHGHGLAGRIDRTHIL